MRLRTVLPLAATFCYPLIIYGLLRAFGPQALVIPLCAVALIRAYTGQSKWGVAVLLGLAVATLASGDSLPAKFYPVAVNFGLLSLFGHSLWKPPSLVEKIARMQDPNLDPRAVPYTRRVTQVWCIFFVLNGTVAAWLALEASDEVWALYTGGIAYLLAGALFIGEFLVRQHKRRLWNHV